MCRQQRFEEKKNVAKKKKKICKNVVLLFYAKHQFYDLKTQISELFSYQDLLKTDLCVLP